MTDTTTMTGAEIATPFGSLIWRPEAELELPMGLPGFDDTTHCLLGPVPNHPGPFQILHGLGEMPFDLLVVPLDCLEERASPDEIESIRADLGIGVEDLLVLCIVTLPKRGDTRPAQVNLRAPIFIDVANRTAVQVVLSNARYAFRMPLVAA